LCPKVRKVRISAVVSSWKNGPAAHLNRLVEASGVSKTEIGRRLQPKRSDSTINRWCSGERTPNADDLARVLEIVGGSADEVLGLKPPALDPGVTAALADAADVLVKLAPQLRQLHRGSAGKR